MTEPQKQAMKSALLGLAITFLGGVGGALLFVLSHFEWHAAPGKEPPAMWPYVVAGLVAGIAATYAWARWPTLPTLARLAFVLVGAPFALPYVGLALMSPLFALLAIGVGVLLFRGKRRPPSRPYLWHQPQPLP